MAPVVIVLDFSWAERLVIDEYDKFDEAEKAVAKNPQQFLLPIGFVPIGLVNSLNNIHSVDLKYSDARVGWLIQAAFIYRQSAAVGKERRLDDLIRGHQEDKGQ